MIIMPYGWSGPTAAAHGPAGFWHPAGRAAREHRGPVSPIRGTVAIYRLLC
jgi:hypothetical protein